MIIAQENSETNPVCPQCKQEIQTVHYQTLSGFMGRRYLYFCPRCRSVLGVSHRKGFWMG